MREKRTCVTLELMDLQNKLSRMDSRLGHQYPVAPLLRAGAPILQAPHYSNPFGVYCMSEPL